MSLREYQRKRHFQKTPEPRGTTHPPSGRMFVVQKHAASHLHYDFRLEMDGVLKSWAVPKGPCLDPSVKRLAMQVEDHPVEYGSFEGIIPKGEYGGGTVMLWDHGEWEPVGDPEEGYRTGKFKFRLHGQKLRGGWMLVRTGGRSSPDAPRRQWLLFKVQDDEAKPISDVDILDEMPLSVTTGRNMPDIAADRDQVWGDKDGAARRKPVGTRAATAPAQFRSARKTGAPMPARIDAQLATRADEAPSGNQWLHEVKFDGYRIICRLDNRHVKLISRNHKDWTERFVAIADAARTLPARQAIFDGEIVALRPDGVSDFQSLQNAYQDRRGALLHYFIFDLLYLDGKDLTPAPLEERRAALAALLKKTDLPPPIHLSEEIEGNGPAFLRAACQKGLEGIISKRRDRPYVPGRGSDWLKIKCVQTDEFVIGGYTDPEGARVGFGALLLGYHDAKGELIYAGKVGTGYGDSTLKALFKKLEPLRGDQSPFRDHKRAVKGTHWVAPTLVAQVTFGSRTRSGLLRHASFQGLREDKSAHEVTREKALPLRAVLKEGPARKRSPSRPDATTKDNVEYDTARKLFAGVRLTSPDKILYPEQDITKLELANYYRSVADWMLPQVADRPLVLVRCPQGRDKECFYQKHPGPGSPDAFRLVSIAEKTKAEPYIVVDDIRGLISLAQVGALEVHAWGAHAETLEQPDRLIFDLDPDPEVAWARVVQSARQIREFLQQLGLESFVKTTGGKGLHLVVPVEPSHAWETVKDFCKRIADAIVRADSSHYTANMSKAARRGKIYLDYLRNGRGATAVVAYSTRARPGAPVSTPLSWDELSPRIHSDHFTIRNVMKRLNALKRDPWRKIGSVRQSLDLPMKTLNKLFP
jgi:bifunctional non-homologous end joining protein LigD